ncbi:MAG: SprT family zinc-dependent metalloprotease [Bacteroidales bacterium]
MESSGTIKYKINFSRRRTMSIIVSPDKGVVVKAPHRTPLKTIERFVSEKSDWILKTLKRFNVLVRLDNRNGYSDGDPVLLYGSEYKLKVTPSDCYSVRLGNDHAIEAGFLKDNNPLIIKLMLEEWFKFIAKDKLAAKFREVQTKYKDYGFLPSGFTVRTMKSRWGSCSSKGKVNLSYDLVRLDEIYSEYVIIHELCHLRHHNHGAGFYELLSEVYPRWKEVREGLKKYIR